MGTVEEHHTLSHLQLPKCMGGKAKTCSEKAAGIVSILTTLSLPKSLQNASVIPSHKTITFLDCYMNANPLRSK